MVGLSFDGLSCGHGRRGPLVIEDARASCGPGRLVGLIGPNGSGKSTLLSTLCGILRPLAGSILLEGRPTSEHSAQALARLAAIVLTETERPAHATARDVASLGRHPYTGFLGFLSPEDARLVDEALEKAGAADLADRPFAELSDGERRRVLIARALAQDTPILLLDEPEVFLDLPAKRRLLSLLGRISREGGSTVVVSLHDLELALDSCDELWLLKGRPGSPSSLLSGVPEELALDGSIGSAFGVPAVGNGNGEIDASPEPFPPSSSALDLIFPRHGRNPARGSLALEGGSPAERFWTARLLSRLGFDRGPDLGSLRIERTDRTTWRLRPRSGPDTLHGGLGSLAAALESGQYPTV